MRKWVLALAMAAFLSSCASLSLGRQADESRASVAEITHLEESWTTAFNNRDAVFMEQAMAPEYILVASGRPGAATITRRADWMRVWLGEKQIPYQAKILEVVVAGDTAVATLAAQWRRESLLTDTWSRRNGRWQLILRHSAARP
jgi:ketosteroid isomerase-like protein